MRRMAFVVLLAACADRPATPPAAVETGESRPAPDAAALVTADTVTVELPLALPSQLYVEHDASIYARSSGIIEAITVDLGTRVTAGQLLARLENTDQTIALDQARERHTDASRQVTRQRALKTAGVVTQADSERVELEFREAELALQKAQRDYDLTRVVAPFGGVITARTARIGRLVAPGDSLFRLTALAPVLAAVQGARGSGLRDPDRRRSGGGGPAGRDRQGQSGAGEPGHRCGQRHPGGRPAARRRDPTPARLQRHGTARLAGAPRRGGASRGGG